MGRYYLSLALTLAVCFAVQSYALKSSGGRTLKSESNFFSSVARIQTGSQGSPVTMCLGSSITGRLPDRAQGFEGVSNMGIDGGSSADTLRAIDRGLIECPRYLIIEANTLYRALGQGPGEVAAALDSAWFRCGVKIPNLGAAARPSAFVYSWLMKRKFGTAAPTADSLPVPSSRPAVPAGLAADLPAVEQNLVDELGAILRRLEGKGTRCLVVILPPGTGGDPVRERLAVELARSGGQPFWDLAAALPENTVSFTDGVHMDPASAAMVCRLLLAKVRP